MRGKSQTKNGSARLAKRSGEGEGSRWELIVFGLFFVTIVFLLGTVARAAGTAPATTHGHAASHAPKATHKTGAHGKAHMSSITTSHQQLVTLPRSGAFPPTSASQPSKSMGSYTTSLSNRMNSRTTFSKPTVSAPGSNWALSGALTIETSRNLDASKETDFTGTYLLAPTLIYVPAKVSFGLTAIYGAEYSYYRPDGRAGDFEDVKYGLRKTWKNNDDFKSVLIDDIFIGVGGFLPTSNSAIQRGFRGSYGPRLGVSKKIDRLTLAYIFGYSRGMFDREKNPDGSSAYPDTWINVGMVTYNFTDSVSIGATGEYAYMVDFENYTTGAQRAILSLDYKATANVGFSLGLATVRSTIDLVQQTETFKFYEKESTLAFLDLILSI